MRTRNITVFATLLTVLTLSLAGNVSAYRYGLTVYVKPVFPNVPGHGTSSDPYILMHEIPYFGFLKIWNTYRVYGGMPYSPNPYARYTDSPMKIQINIYWEPKLGVFFPFKGIVDQEYGRTTLQCYFYPGGTSSVTGITPEQMEQLCMLYPKEVAYIPYMIKFSMLGVYRITIIVIGNSDIFSRATIYIRVIP